MSGLKTESIHIRLDYSFRELYPAARIWLISIDNLKNYVRPASGKDTITLKIEFESLYYHVSNDPALHGQIIKKYAFEWDKQLLTEIR